MNAFGQWVGMCRKDMLIEWRRRARVASVACFALLVLLLFSFAIGPETEALRRHAGAYLWLAMLFASTLALSQSFRVEVESDALDALRLLPVSPAAFFYGKAVVNTLVLVLLGAALAPLLFAIFDVTMQASPWRLLLVLLLGAAGLAGPGTLYSGMTSRAPGQEILLPVLLFPLIVPALLASVKATALVIAGDPMRQSAAWLTLLVCFDVIYWSLCGLLFGRVIED